MHGYDYSKSGYYYVTICTDNHKQYFGQIENNQMLLNNAGNIVTQQWLWLSKQYSYVTLDEFVVMPNHLHGILFIDNSIRPARELALQVKSLSSLIGAIKTTSSKLIRKNEIQDFAWQRSFYDHVIRTDTSLHKIRAYITNNPTTWEDDDENPDKIKP